MNIKIFIESLKQLGIPRSTRKTIKMIAESVAIRRMYGEDDDDADDDYEVDISNSYFITRPRNTVQIPIDYQNARMTFSYIMKNGVEPLMQMITGEIPDDIYLYDTMKDVSCVETAAFLLNLSRNLNGKERDMLISAVYKYPLTKLAQKFGSYEGTASINVGISKNNYLVFECELYIIALPYIPELCVDMEEYLSRLPFTIEDKNVASRVSYHGTNSVQRNVGQSGQSIGNKLTVLGNRIDSIDDDGGVEEFYNLITTYAGICTSSRDMDYMLTILDDGDSMFIEGGWPLDDDSRISALSAFVKKWSGLGGYVTIDSDNNIVCMGESDVIKFPLDENDVVHFAMNNGIDVSSDERVDEVDDEIPDDDFYDDNPYVDESPLSNEVAQEPVSKLRTQEASHTTLADILNAKNQVELSADDAKKEHQRQLAKMQELDKQREERKMQDTVNGLPSHNIPLHNPALSPESNEKREAKFSMIPAVLDLMKNDGVTDLPNAAWITAVSKIISKYNHNANAIDSPAHIRQVADALENKRVPSEIYQEMRRIKNAIMRNQNGNQNNRGKPFRPNRW